MVIVPAHAFDRSSRVGVGRSDGVGAGFKGHRQRDIPDILVKSWHVRFWNGGKFQFFSFPYHHSQWNDGES
jgi:hypothetical protein